MIRLIFGVVTLISFLNTNGIAEQTTMSKTKSVSNIKIKVNAQWVNSDSNILSNLIVTYKIVNNSDDEFWFLEGHILRNHRLRFFNDSGSELYFEDLLFVHTSVDLTPLREWFFELKPGSEWEKTSKYELKQGILDYIENKGPSRYEGRYLYSPQNDTYLFLKDTKSIYISGRYYLLGSEMEAGNKMISQGVLFKSKIISPSIRISIR